MFTFVLLTQRIATNDQICFFFVLVGKQQEIKEKLFENLITLGEIAMASFQFVSHVILTLVTPLASFCLLGEWKETKTIFRPMCSIRLCSICQINKLSREESENLSKQTKRL